MERHSYLSLDVLVWLATDRDFVGVYCSNTASDLHGNSFVALKNADISKNKSI